MFISYDLNWTSNRKEEFEQQNTMQKTNAMESIESRLEDIHIIINFHQHPSISNGLHKVYLEKYNINESKTVIHQNNQVS